MIIEKRGLIAYIMNRINLIFNVFFLHSDANLIILKLFLTFLINKLEKR